MREASGEVEVALTAPFLSGEVTPMAIAFSASDFVARAAAAALMGASVTIERSARLRPTKESRRGQNEPVITSSEHAATRGMAGRYVKSQFTIAVVPMVRQSVRRSRRGPFPENAFAHMVNRGTRHVPAKAPEAPTAIGAKGKTPAHDR